MTNKPLLIDDYLTEKVGVCEIKSGLVIILDPTNDLSLLQEGEYLKTPVVNGNWIVELDRDPESYKIAALCLWHEDKAKDEKCVWEEGSKTLLADSLVECIDASAFSPDDKAKELKETLSKCYTEIQEDGYYTKEEEESLIKAYNTNRLTVNNTMNALLRKDIIPMAGIIFKSGAVCMANTSRCEYQCVDLLLLDKEVVGIQISFLYPDKDAPDLDDEIEALEVEGCS